MSHHRVSLHLAADGTTIRHVQSTNGPDWPGPLEEQDENGDPVPLIRRDILIEAEPSEIRAGNHGRPAHRKAADLRLREIEIPNSGDSVRYKAGSGRTGRITNR